MACATTKVSKRFQPRVPFSVFAPYIRHGKGWNVSDTESEWKGQKEWAQDLGLSRRTIGRWVEFGVPFRYVEAVCRRLGKHPVELLGREHTIFQETDLPQQLAFFRLEDDPVLGEVARELSGP